MCAARAWRGGHGATHSRHLITAAAMAALLAPSGGEAEQAEYSEELGFFFKSLGSICFTPAGDGGAYPGCAAVLASAPRAGALFFGDAQGEGAREGDGRRALPLRAVAATRRHAARLPDPVPRRCLPPSLRTQVCTRCALPAWCPSCKCGATATSEGGRTAGWGFERT